MVASATQTLCCDIQEKSHRFLHRPSIGPIQISFDEYKLAAMLRAKTRLELAVGKERQISLFPLCPLCECLPLAGVPSNPAPNSTLQHCYTTFIMLIS